MTHALAIAYPIGVAVLVLAIAHRPLARWYRKVKRRRGGVYLWRVDHHRNRARRVNGYVGETVSFYFRSKQHMGMSHYAPGSQERDSIARRFPAQPWSDLNPKMYKVLPLPWWLCWKWVLRPLETLVILCTWPVYNDAKNRWNPRRIGRATAAANRSWRDQGWERQVFRIWTAHLLRRTLIGLALLVACLGAYTWEVYR